MDIEKGLKGTKIEFHIIQSFPVTCLNRNDAGSPKTAFIGGVERARVSSQCWKRAIRTTLGEMGVKLGVRTKKVQMFIAEHCEKIGATPEQAQECGEFVAAEMVGEALLFISDEEAQILAQYCLENEFTVKKLSVKQIEKIAQKHINKHYNAVDIALFGRMIAKASTMSVQAASSFNHAISTHKVVNEMDFYTALDDFEVDSPQSAHIGAMEYNSATYYRYVSLDLGQLVVNLGLTEKSQMHALIEAVESFIKALFIAVPSAKQSTQSGFSSWDFARVYIRKGQPLQVGFDKAIKSNNGYSVPSIEHVRKELDAKEAMYGSMFNKIESFEWGLDESVSFDDLIQGITSVVGANV
ncbi:type I-E CRISPR-associated protein Cas7/Cse4/CasC [Vibrio barjaei]|uniref:type I-E CRISPR-associated protein Cas7/Cse4/CasC n=1 Tax=Vibrio barjaei TaxID=1676683 RepID=UPI002284241A|nr:type I-E CRISPR-associated protein Cas7/Cse4/CasC [Vibrio barjaei]MCY9874527.1 type I-E CRISPR-associated protein Cas7/Cse4/CasC [Vibrio barjaei]